MGLLLVLLLYAAGIWLVVKAVSKSKAASTGPGAPACPPRKWSYPSDGASDRRMFCRVCAFKAGDGFDPRGNSE